MVDSGGRLLFQSFGREHPSQPFIEQTELQVLKVNSPLSLCHGL